MNFMHLAMSKTFTKDPKMNKKIENLIFKLNDTKYTFADHPIDKGNGFYYNNALPIVSANRDVLEKDKEVCKMWVNWGGTGCGCTYDLVNNYNAQYGFKVITVDAGYKRNKYQNKESAWVVYNTADEAINAMKFFNSFFLTALEIDAINEYKKCKQSPDKRPLTFDQVIGPSVYDLYEQVDNNEL